MKRVYKAAGLAAPDFVEIAANDQQGAEKFGDSIQASKDATRFGASVCVYPAADYQNMRLFITKDGSSGFALKPDGDIVSVFSSGGAGHSTIDLAARLTNLSNGLARLLERKLDQIEDDDDQLSKTAPKDIALLMGIVTDKAAALSNQPTVVIEHRSGPTIEDVMIEIQAARDRVAAKLKAQSLEVEEVPLPIE